MKGSCVMLQKFILSQKMNSGDKRRHARENPSRNQFLYHSSRAYCKLEGIVQNLPQHLLTNCVAGIMTSELIPFKALLKLQFV